MTAPELVSAELALSLCAHEPIHRPGAIQPHGAVVAAQLDGGLITHASANLAAILGMPAEAVLGRPLAEAIGAAAAQAILGGVQRTAADPGEQRIVTAHGTTLDLHSHRTGLHICIDIEPLRSEPWQRPTIALAQGVLDRFRDAASQADLCDRAVRGLRKITGYDRVMAYRFGADGHGQVIAEARAAGLAAYLGQYYPASDIPPQARRQYLAQRVGAIADSAYQPVALLTEPRLDDGVPLDLTRSALRSVSPVHRHYMRNMKTGASLTIGLAQGPSSAPVLWGMLVCHHAVPRIAGPDLRSIAGMIGQVVSLLLGSIGGAEITSRRIERNLTLGKIASRLAAPVPFIDTQAAMSSELIDLVDATGAVVRMAGETVCLGRTPAPQAAEAALALLYPGSGGDVVALDDLGVRHPSLAACLTEGSGALLLPLADSGDDAILWFRPERTSTITWGGNPAEHATSDPVTGDISPRVSFESWKEIVRGHAAPWHDGDLLVAGALRQVIDAEVARRTKTAAGDEKREHERERQQKRRELEQSNADLEEFAWAVSHDLKAPLRAIGHLAQWIGEDLGTTANPETRENIKLMQARVVRMQKLLEGLLEYSCLDHTDALVETVDVADVVADVVEMLAPPPHFSVAFLGESLGIRTERVAIQMVLENLISNGLKHHDRGQGRVTVTMRRSNRAVEIRVEDDGPGIAEPFQQRIFTIFQTLKSRDEVEGSGIGLAIATRKVETHGGRIWVESAPPARGTTFVFTWQETAL